MRKTTSALVLQNCPKCGAVPVVNNPKPRHWYVACSANSAILGGHQVQGHPMFTKREAITVWNEQT